VSSSGNASGLDPIVKAESQTIGGGRDKPGHDKIENWFKTTGNSS
jgi:hypothetical protein